MSTVECVLPWQATVGETPVWSASEQRLYWIDISQKQIHRFNPKTAINETFELSEIVTSLALRATGGLILTLAQHFAFFNPSDGSLERLAGVELDRPHNRFNDGKCDSAGRFWAGTMDAVDWSAPAGGLYRLDADLRPRAVASDVICGNGLGFSPDGRTMYFTESFRYTVFAYDCDPLTGALERRRPFLHIDRKSGGFPDGLTVDSEGCVWSNVVGLGEVRRYDPEGRLERVISLPVPRCTACVFGGPALDILYMTTARETMTPAALAAAPLSGSLFAIDCGIRGLPAAECAF